MFLQYLKKKVSKLLLCSIDAKYSDILWGSVMFSVMMQL